MKEIFTTKWWNKGTSPKFLNPRWAEWTRSLWKWCPALFVEPSPANTVSNILYNFLKKPASSAISELITYTPQWSWRWRTNLSREPSSSSTMPRDQQSGEWGWVRTILDIIQEKHIKFDKSRSSWILFRRNREKMFDLYFTRGKSAS